MSPVILPVTLATASALTLVYFGIVFRVMQSRVKGKVSIGDGGDPDMLMRMRTQANFVEYVPLMLILMALLELSGVSRTVLAYAGGAFVLFRIMHAVGMPRPVPNIYRAVGATLTLVLMLAGAVYGLVVAFGA
jgi:uncharacterized membrane protein YecN with MAPEG domain